MTEAGWINQVARLENPIQTYAWGSRTAISKLLGYENPSKTPQAELWMGAHPKAPSMVVMNGKRRSLAELIAEEPVGMLGESAARRFDNQMPYLFKVLAAAKPLSIQAHPSLAQARQGFARENRQGVPLSAAHRNYRDANHKPECLCALTPFWGLCGFRPIADLLARMAPICPELAPELDLLSSRRDAAGLRRFFNSLMTLDGPRKQSVIRAGVARAQALADRDPVCRWIGRLFSHYPDDVMVLAPLVLNLVRLDPGQALFLASGQLHAYLEGVGIELMANSDNVLRGGLTAKHKDVPQLLEVLSFQPAKKTLAPGEAVSEVETRYATPAKEFSLSAIRIARGHGSRELAVRSVAILLCVQGEARLTSDDGQAMRVTRGQSVLAPAGVLRLSVSGDAVFYKADVPVP